jgi:hypothetical protein
MSHLNPETLARLVDEAPDAAERAHLDACADCRRMLEDMRADLAALQSLPALEPPVGEWERIEARLAAEGLLRRPAQRLAWRAVSLRAAATLAVFLMGAAAGVAWLTPGGSGPAIAADPTAATANVPAFGIGTLAGQPGAQVLVEALAGRAPRSRDEAALLLAEAEALYLDALGRVALYGPAGPELGDPYARLAALEGIAAITRAALGQAPADPVLNGYHVTAIAQREALLRQIATASRASWF